VSWLPLLWVALAGSGGAVARFIVDGVVRSRFGRRFPLGTVTINVTGSLLLGVLTGVVLFHHQPSLWTTVGGTGFCGGYTTFSTASFETVRLMQARDYRLALLNGGGTLVLTVGAGAVGLVIGHA
jgi:CrcB protein